MKDLVNVLIPILDTNLTPNQSKILSHCLSVLGQYPIIFISYEGADMAWVEEYKPNADIVSFPKEYFQSRQTLAKLFLMQDFYDRFSWTDFLLIHELNTWIVRDELHYWCKQGYDYLKAPPLTQNDPKYPKSTALLLGLNAEQKGIVAEGFNENGLYLCHVQRMIKALQKKSKTAYQYRHNESIPNRDSVFWEVEANRLWPSLRKPTEPVRAYFSKSLINSTFTSEDKNKTIPFAYTGINSNNIDNLPFEEVKRKK